MSQLIDKFHKASSGTTVPMGFRASRPTPAAPKLLIIAGLKGLPDKPAAYTEGADAVLIRTEEAPGEKELRKLAGTFGDMPWGLYLEDGGEGLEKAGELGLDFVVFSIASRVGNNPPDKKIGKILEVDSSMDDGLLRAVNQLPVDAVLLADGLEAGPLLWHQLLIFQHLADLFPKPLTIPAPIDISGAELKALWEAGVDGILVTADNAGGIKELRQAVNALPPRAGRKGGARGVTLPRAAAEGQPPLPPDEEEEEEDE